MQLTQRLFHLLTLLVVAWTGPAAAFHTEERPLVDGTAYTHKRGTVRVGLCKAQVSIWDPFTLGTYQWLWLLRAPNLHAKLRVLQHEQFALALSAGVLAINSSSFSKL